MLNKVLSALVILITVTTAVLGNFSQARASEIPLGHFSKMPMVSSPVISPDGQHIGVILNQGEFTQIAIVKFDNPSDMKVILQLGAEKYRIEQFHWANNERVIVNVSQPYRAWEMNVRTSHLYSASIDGTDVKELRKKSRKQSREQFYRSSPKLLSTLPHQKQHILVTMSDERDNNYSSVFKVNIENGEFEKYLPNSDRITSWVPNRRGEILFAVGRDKDYRKDISYYYARKSAKDDWTLVKKRENFKGDTFDAYMYEQETNSIIVGSDYMPEGDESAIRTRLWRYSVDEAKFTQLLGEAPSPNDVTDVITRQVGDNTEVIGFKYNDGFEQFVYFDPTSSKMAQQIRPLFAKRGLEAFLFDWDVKKQRFIILTLSDSKPPTYYTFDQPKGSLKAWYGAYPELAKAQLSKVERFDFEARDGSYLHGFLTLPNGVKKPPVVLFPHGGPYNVFDSKYFDPFVQMFASRGYAVMQVNFRGSGGSGNALEASGYGEWGKKMQTDLIDALDYVVGTGKVHKKKACIAGASYGGYAALAAGYQTPERFQCIISIAGVSDMNLLVRNFRKRGGHAFIKNAIGDNTDTLDDISPIMHIDKFKAPVLLIHGKVDTRVGYRQSENMYEALKKAGKKVDYELFEYGTHNLDDAGNRVRAMQMMEAFLKQHL